MNSRYPIIKLPSDIQFTLYLIREELKCRKFFNTLHEVGLDDAYYRPHLDSLILRCVNLDDDSDATFNAYDDIMERRSKKIDADHELTTKQALKAYYELVELRKRLNKTNKNVGERHAKVNH